jgi:hypothetical protein
MLQPTYLQNMNERKERKIRSKILPATVCHLVLPIFKDFSKKKKKRERERAFSRIPGLIRVDYSS